MKRTPDFDCGVRMTRWSWALQMPGHSIFQPAQDYAATNLLMLVDGLPSIKINHAKPPTCT